jgi:mono/diheme cytochrome c family protein
VHGHVVTVGVLASWVCSLCLAVIAPRLHAETSTSAVIGQDGPRTIWDGVYTKEQASRGRQIYEKSCGQCHSDDLSGGGDGEPPLAGVIFMSQWNGQTLADLFTRMSESMPYTAPGSLRAQEYLDIVSYILTVNGAPAGAGELPSNREKLKQILFTDRAAAAPAP